MMGMPELPSPCVTLAPIMVHLLEHILLLCGDCGMVISAMLNVTIIIIILTINRKDSEDAMPYVPKSRRPPRFISINVIYRIMTSACQYVEHHIQNYENYKEALQQQVQE